MAAEQRCNADVIITSSFPKLQNACLSCISILSQDFGLLFFSRAPEDFDDVIGIFTPGTIPTLGMTTACVGM